MTSLCACVDKTRLAQTNTVHLCVKGATGRLNTVIHLNWTYILKDNKDTSSTAGLFSALVFDSDLYVWDN